MQSSQRVCSLVGFVLSIELILLVTWAASADRRKDAAYQLVEAPQYWSISENPESPINRLLLLANVEDPKQDSFTRFYRSSQAFDLKTELIRAHQSSGQLPLKDVKTKNLNQFQALKRSLEPLRNEPNLVIMLVDSHSSIINGHEHEILKQFNEFHRTNNTRLLFTADSLCWPDSKLADFYPTLALNEQKRFLNSRALIGLAPALWDLVDSTANSLKEDDKLILERVDYDFQRYCTYVYLDKHQRDRLNMELDHRSSLFASLNAPSSDRSALSNSSAAAAAALDFGEFELDFKNDSADHVELRNTVYNTRPLIVTVGSGAGRIIELNSLGNYLGKAWTARDGCRHCNNTMISLASIKDSDLPKVLIGIFIEEPTPFMASFFDTLRELNYPKSQIHLFIHNAIEYHAQHVGQFVEKFGPKYASLELVDHKPNQLNEAQARDYSLLKCKQLSCDYYLSLDSLARLEEPNSLRYLIETNRTVVAPLLSRPGKLWSNFWGSITSDGYYERSHDYVELVTGQRLGVWDVPLVMNAYLIEGKFLRSSLENLNSVDEAGTVAGGQSLKLTYFDAKFPTVKPVLIFGRQLRLANVLQSVSNMRDFGHLVDATNYNISHMYPDFYELTTNRHDWEREYLHENYTDLFDERDEDESNYPNRIRLEQPCPDVYWFPVVSERFCNQLVAMMERFGQWSSGTNSDPRIEGGYESVPTRDIHFKQVGLHDMWLFFLREYVMPIQLKEYIGYEHDPPRTDLAFVVRYHPSEQPSLRPHHDSSTYTLNIALNTPGADYQGGGCRFVRYNCSVTESRKGWALIHPGRLTHYHEGLPVTNGTRYILVTFIDP